MTHLLTALLLLAWGEANFVAAQAQKTRGTRTRVALPVLLDSVEVFIAIGADSIAARAEAERIKALLYELRAHAATPKKIQLREAREEGTVFIMLDTLEVLEVRHENRIDTERSPLANALMLRDQIWAAPATVAKPPAAWNEEELLLRLLLGVIYPFSLLVVLRLTRIGIRRWEKNWHSALLKWLNRFAERRGLSEADVQSQRLINILTGIERLLLYGAVFVLLSFTWFALFPQTQVLATALLARIIGPMLDLLGGTARGVLLLVYTFAVALLAYWLTKHLSQRRQLVAARGMLADPVIYFPLRLSIWIVALFFILFPYPGAPRLFAVGVLLIALLAALIALRPLIEEIAAGIYLNSTHGLKTGDRLTLNDTSYVVVALGLLHLRVMRDDKQHWIPYSRILKADLAVATFAKEHA